MFPVDELNDSLESRFEPPSRRVMGAVAAAIAALAVVVVLVIAFNRPATGKPGRLTEAATERPASLVVPTVVDATAEWGLAGVRLGAADDAMAGGSAVADLDGDRQQELVVANGDVAVFRWNGDGYGDPQFLGITQAIGVAASDVDLDGFADLLIATAGDVDYVVWGGDWPATGVEPERIELASRGQSSGLLAGELTGDGLIDIVRLGRGMTDPFPDVLWTATGARMFDARDLPGPDRFTLAGELVDADGDGLLDIWLTRDVGWAEGGDSVLSRQGDAAGDFVDVAAELGAALEIDGMGITIADLNGDAVIDAYVSDLGDNELLLGSGQGFAPSFDNGAAHIRPVGAADDLVSSTWGTGALDLNLDGVLDLVLGSGGFPDGGVRNKIDGTQVVVEEPPAVLLGLGDGTFVDVWASLDIDLDLVARGLTVADLDRDGDDDVLIVDRRGTIHVLRNDTEGPTITTYVTPGCGGLAGRIATVTTETGVYQRLLAPHGYASSHAPEIIVGNPTGGQVDVTMTGPFDSEVDRAPWTPLNRPLRSFDCR